MEGTRAPWVATTLVRRLSWAARQQISANQVHQGNVQRAEQAYGVRSIASMMAGACMEDNVGEDEVRIQI